MDRLGIGLDAVRRGNRVVYCSTTATGRPGPVRVGRHDLNYLRRRLPRLLGPQRRAVRRPGATVGGTAGGGMQAVIAILAALVHRCATRRGRDARRVVSTVVSLISLYVDEYFATGEIPGPSQHPHRPLRLLRRVPLRRRPLDRGGRDRASLFCKPLPGLCDGSRTRPTTVQARCADFRAAFARTRRVGRRLRPADTCVSEVATVPELVGRTLPGAGLHSPMRRPARRVRSSGLGAAGMDRDQPPGRADASVTDTDELLGEVGYSAAEIAALREEGVAA
jgi:crotonobetainyl-CoA:carnitine CoA-transferase CaiB-like acyl-CoA transferase